MKPVPMPDKSILYSIKMFRGLTVGALESIHARMRYKCFHKSDVLLAFGQQSSNLFWIHTGSVKICDRIPAYLNDEVQNSHESVLNVAGPGSPLGEINFLDGKGHSASVTALEDTACFVLKGADFRHFLKEFPLLQDNFSSHLASMIRDKTAKIYSLTRQNLEGSIAEQLLTLAERLGQPNDVGQIFIDIPLTQSLLANMTGHERSSVAHTLSAFKGKKWISIGKEHRITILDAKALRNYRN